MVALDQRNNGLEDKELEFRKVYAVMQSRGLHGRDSKAPLCSINIDLHDVKKRRADPSGRAAPTAPMKPASPEDSQLHTQNYSGLIDPAVGEGTPYVTC